MKQETPKLRIYGDEAWAGTSRSLLPSLLGHGFAQSLLDLLDEGIVVHDEHRRIRLVNRVVEEVTGVPREAILGRDCHEVFPPSGLCGAACPFRGAGDQRNERREHEAVFTRPDGAVRRISIKSTPMEINQRARGVLAVVRDLTEVEDLRWQLDKRREFHGLVGKSEAIGEVFETIRAVGPSDYPVLISGESGTGKELVAGAIHRESRRRAGPFVPVNCGALPENILESELFGHVRGAFTGAIRDKKGRFELADGGTIFLDEVGELPLHLQVNLLRVIQEKTFERVGGERTMRVDVRIVAATNRDLRQMIAQGTFREDLFYRLCVVPVELPPLRDRREDIPIIARSILAKVSKEAGKRIEEIDDEAMSLLMRHAWPGNVRELINAIQFASVRCRGKTMKADDLPFEMRSGGSDRASRVPMPDRGITGPLAYEGPAAGRPPGRGRGRLSPEAVRGALAATGGNRMKAAALLGVGRATLYRFFDDHPELGGE
jgi:PAS domain S-box-containing protein